MAAVYQQAHLVKQTRLESTTVFASIMCFAICIISSLHALCKAPRSCPKVRLVVVVSRSNPRNISGRMRLWYRLCGDEINKREGYAL